jgi:AraC-like DNA-binding protein/mannose-6-phosphate isomerase-like protein (cupin superfamily)
LIEIKTGEEIVMNDLKAKENRIHSSAQKPYSFYSCILPDQSGYVPMHWHEEFELNYILEGSADFICGEERFIARQGDIIVIQPDKTHSIYPHDGSHTVYDTLVFHSDLFGSSQSDRYIQNCIVPLIDGRMRLQIHLTPGCNCYDELKTTVESIFYCAKGNTPQLDMLLRSDVIRLFWFLEQDAREAEPVTKENELLRNVLIYIQDHFNETITIRQLSDLVHLSESYFMAQFKKSVGFSPIEYILHYRINYACKQLVDTSLTISEIAYESGFRNLSNFNRQFIRMIGCTPLKYRKKNGTSAQD